MDEMIKALTLGIIQGLTEFLPVSSTGHLVLGRKLMGLEEAGLFLDTMLHFGTFLAVVVVFWDDILSIIKRPFSRLSLLILAGTIPTALIGILFEDYFEEISVTGATIGWEFLATGLILWVADYYGKKSSKGINDITYRDALIVGTLQGAAILPAISRSGLTIAGSLFAGMDRQTAARFSFLMSLPAILGANVLLSVKNLSSEGAVYSIGFVPLVVGTLAALFSGYIAIRWMLAILQKGSLKIFSIYVWILGVAILTAQFLGKF